LSRKITDVHKKVRSLRRLVSELENVYTVHVETHSWKCFIVTTWWQPEAGTLKTQYQLLQTIFIDVVFHRKSPAAFGSSWRWIPSTNHLTYNMLTMNF